MATALQKQLAQISEQSKTILNAKAQKAAHSKSLIWEPKVAATQSFQKLYPVCYEGFEELCGLDSRFAPFRLTIFSEQSQNEDRTQLTEEENGLLDRKLESFLRLVASRLRLMPAIKAVEWLIRRFRIHEFNTAFLLTTFLPYHSLPIFVTLLSILPPKMPEEYRFISPYIRSLTPPPRGSLVLQAINQPVFLAKVSEYTLESCRLQEHYQALISFWGGLFTEAVNGLVDKNRSGRKTTQEDNEQALLHHLGPIFSQALVMKKVPQLQIATYMALGVFVSKASLADAAVSAFMEQLAMGWTPESVRPGLVCLSIMGQHRSAKQVPKKVARALLGIPDVGNHLVEIGREWSVDRLANGLCLAMVDRASKRGDARGLPVVAALLRANVLTQKQASVLFKSLLLAGTKLDAEVDRDGSARRGLGSMLVDLSQDPGKCGLIAQKAITDVDFDMEELEMKLDLSLRPARLLAPADEDAAMTDDQPATEKEDLSHAIEKLSSRTDGLAKSLSKEPGPAFDDFSELFLQIIPAPSAAKLLADFEALPALSRESVAADCTALGFYIRIWCGPYPALARLAALDAAKGLLKRGGQGYDFQGLLPYVIAALGDASKKVRQAAADLATVLASLYPEKAKTAKLPVWGERHLYAGAEGWEHLDTETTAKALRSVIVPGLEECVMHPEHIIWIFDGALASTKSKSGNDGTESKGRLSQSTRLAILRFLSSHIIQTPFLMVKERLLRAANRVRSVGSTSRTQLLLPALTWWASLTAEEAMKLLAAERLGETEINQAFVNVVVANDAKGLQALFKIVVETSEAREGFIEAMFARLAKMWPSMRPENKSTVATQMLDLALKPRDAESEASVASTEAAELLRNADLTTEILSSFLESIYMDANSMADSPPAKRRRLSNDSNRSHTVGGDVQSALTRATFILQLIEGSNAAEHADLLPSLFSTLAKLQNLRRLVGSDLGYLQNVVLTSLLAMLPAYRANQKAKITIADGYGNTLVNCIQKSSSPTVQNAALLLVAGLASMAPDVVIHCVMPIFTFMGVSVIRQNDDYSAHVVNQVIKEVVPPLLGSLRKGKKNVVAASSELLLSFTASYEHMPSHRRFPIFVSLVETMGVDEFLFALIALLVDKQGPTDSVLAFVRDLVDRHSVKTQLQTIAKLMSLTGDLFKPAPNLASALFKPSSSWANSDDSKDMPLVQLTALPALLSSKRLRVQIRKVTENDDMQASEVRELYADLLEKVLAMAETVKPRADLYALCGQSLANLLNLLTIGEFIKAVENLLDRPNMGLRQKVLKAMETRVSQESNTDANSRAVLLGFLPQLTAAIRDSDDIRYKHTAVACVDKIAEKYGEKDMEAVSAAASTIAGEHCLGQPDKQLRIMALLCLASLVGVLGHGVIPVLPSAFSYTTKYLRESLAGEESDGELYSACYTLILTVAQHMPEMISGAYLEQLLAISNASAEAGLDEELNEARLACLKCLATQLDAKIFFTGLSKGWTVAAGAGFSAMGEYIELLRTAIASHRELTIRKNIAPLSAIFLSAFDFRRMEYEKGPVNEVVSAKISEVENGVNEVALTMVHKLNDATFRPIFTQLMEWTTSQLPKSDSAGRLRRSQSVYGFLGVFFGQLGRIVTSYATYIIDDAARILNSVSPKTNETTLLWGTTLHVLAKCFENDEDGFWQSPSHFTAVAPMLVEQFRYAPILDVNDSLNPALVELARAASSAAHQKELNGWILKRLRSDQASVRLAAVRCQQKLTERLGEEWLSMLPEMLPYISELQDDDDEEVERETHRWIVAIEGVLGESLDAMLQ